MRSPWQLSAAVKQLATGSALISKPKAPLTPTTKSYEQKYKFKDKYKYKHKYKYWTQIQLAKGPALISKPKAPLTPQPQCYEQKYNIQIQKQIHLEEEEKVQIQFTNTISHRALPWGHVLISKPKAPPTTKLWPEMTRARSFLVKTFLVGININPMQASLFFNLAMKPWNSPPELRRKIEHNNHNNEMKKVIFNL